MGIASAPKHPAPSKVARLDASIIRSKKLHETEMNTLGSKLMDVLKSLSVDLINDALTEVVIKGAAANR